ncbi:MAG: heme exporter protein CcmD [Alphaproteobacteria bacterium]|nr:heme exporter protein CcmD [Alphaproteobacteria bacterium SS10]
MDQYAAYVWSAYAVTGVVTLAVLGLSWRYRRRWMRAAGQDETPAK